MNIQIPFSDFRPEASAQAATDGARFVPVIGDGMEPGLRHGDFVAVVPIDRYRCESLYVFDFGDGPDVYRCSANFRGGIDLYRDNKRHYPDVYTLTREEFAAAVVAQVFATCKVTDCTALELLTGSRQEASA